MISNNKGAAEGWVLLNRHISLFKSSKQFHFSLKIEKNAAGRNRN